MLGSSPAPAGTRPEHARLDASAEAVGSAEPLDRPKARAVRPVACRSQAIGTPPMAQVGTSLRLRWPSARRRSLPLPSAAPLLVPLSTLALQSTHLRSLGRPGLPSTARHDAGLDHQPSQHLQTGFAIVELAAGVVSHDDDGAFGIQPPRRQRPESMTSLGVQTADRLRADSQLGSGVHLVDILATRAAGAGERPAKIVAREPDADAQIDGAVRPLLRGWGLIVSLGHRAFRWRFRSRSRAIASWGKRERSSILSTFPCAPTRRKPLTAQFVRGWGPCSPCWLRAVRGTAPCSPWRRRPNHRRVRRQLTAHKGLPHHSPHPDLRPPRRPRRVPMRLRSCLAGSASA